jgi:hypothetical protein
LKRILQKLQVFEYFERVFAVFAVYECIFINCVCSFKYSNYPGAGGYSNTEEKVFEYLLEYTVFAGTYTVSFMQ